MPVKVHYQMLVKVHYQMPVKVHYQVPVKVHYQMPVNLWYTCCFTIGVIFFAYLLTWCQVCRNCVQCPRTHKYARNSWILSAYICPVAEYAMTPYVCICVVVFQANVSQTAVTQPPFIRALTTAICRSVIRGQTEFTGVKIRARCKESCSPISLAVFIWGCH